MTASSLPPDRALLFDLDGTLVDTWEANYRSYRDSLAEIGRACTPSAFAPCFGKHWRDFLPELAGSTDEALLKRLHRRKQELYPGHFPLVTVNHQLVSLLRASRGTWGIGLVTTASRANTTAMLAHLGLDDAFDRIVTGDDVRNPKPDPEGYRRCLDELGAQPAKSLAFEDSPTGIAAARSAGIQVLAIHGFPAKST